MLLCKPQASWKRWLIFQLIQCTKANTDYKIVKKKKKSHVHGILFTLLQCIAYFYVGVSLLWSSPARSPRPTRSCGPESGM